MDLDVDRKHLSGAPAPAAGTALGLLAGAAAAPHLSYLPPAALIALIALGLASASRGGRAVAALAFGLLNAGMGSSGPLPEAQRPIDVAGVVSSHPIRRDTGTFFYVRSRRWRQGDEVGNTAFDLQVSAVPQIEPPPIGTSVRLRGHLRRPSRFANLAPQPRPGAWRLRLKSARLMKVEAPPGELLRLAGRLRRAVETAYEPFDPHRGGLVLTRALVLGDRSLLPRRQQQALRRSGLAHLLAVSGLHVGLLAAMFLLPAAALPSRWRYLPALLGLVLYLLLLGPRPAALRAALMGLAAFAALALHRPPHGINALACAVALMVLDDPAIVARLGFQLSVAATGGILVLAPAFAERWQRLPGAVRGPLAITVAAQLATLPWTVPLAGGLHPAAPLLNLLAIPWLMFFLLVAFSWTAVALASGVAAGLALPLLDAAASPVALITALPPSPTFFLPLGLGGPAALALCLGGIALGLWPRRAARAGLGIWLLLLTGVPGRAPGPPELVALDVGQGDATLIRDGRHAVLVDGGGWSHGDLGGRVVVPALAALGIHRLRALVLTHPDRDHCAGLVDVARYLVVEEIWMGPGWIDEPCATALLATSVRRWRVLWRGETERIGRWRLAVLHPEPGRRRQTNDRSLVIQARVGRRRVLLTGDIEAAAERHLLRRPSELRADVLKVAHHGSKTSTGAPFLRAVKPSLALISAGRDNSHGHPHPTILRRLRGAGVQILRIDRVGMVRLRFADSGVISIDLPGSPRQP